MVQGVYPAHNGPACPSGKLAPSRLIPYLRYDKDSHAGHTQCIKIIAEIVVNSRVMARFNLTLI
jgi:hypothetical protein